MAKILYHDFFFSMVLSRFFVIVGFTIVSDQCGQNHFPIIKTKPFKVTKSKKVWWIFRPKWANIKIFVIILSLLLKLGTKKHITNTHSIQINQTFYFQVQ